MHFWSGYVWTKWQGCWLGFSSTAHNTVSRGIQMFVFCSILWQKGSHACRRACLTSASWEWFSLLAASSALLNCPYINQNFTALRYSFNSFWFKLSFMFLLLVINGISNKNLKINSPRHPQMLGNLKLIFRGGRGELFFLSLWLYFMSVTVHYALLHLLCVAFIFQILNPFTQVLCPALDIFIIQTVAFLLSYTNFK